MFIDSALTQRTKTKQCIVDKSLHDVYTKQGNLKGESVVAAIMPLCMEASYCTSRFLRSYARQIILLKRELPFPRELKTRILVIARWITR